jgi:hypothetical protein
VLLGELNFGYKISRRPTLCIGSRCRLFNRTPRRPSSLSLRLIRLLDIQPIPHLMNSHENSLTEWPEFIDNLELHAEKLGVSYYRP